MSAGWPPLAYGTWSATCDTLHAHTQVLGKLAVQLAPPEPQLQHAALRLTARGWETLALPAPDGSGAIVAALDLRTHEAAVEHFGRPRDTDCPDAEPSRRRGDARSARGRRAARRRSRDQPGPQEVPWTAPLDEDDQHATYDSRPGGDLLRGRHPGGARPGGGAGAVSRTLDAGQRLVGHLRPRGQLLLRKPADPPSDDFIMRNGGDAEQVSIGWWPGDPNHEQAAFFAFAYPRLTASGTPT